MASPVRTPDRHERRGAGWLPVAAILTHQPPSRRMTGVRHDSQLRAGRRATGQPVSEVGKAGSAVERLVECWARVGQLFVGSVV